MKVVVLGSGGFIGSAVVARAYKLGWEVVAVLGPRTKTTRLDHIAPGIVTHAVDLHDAKQLAEIIHAQQPEAIIQTVFPSGHADGQWSRRRDYFEDGTRTALTLAEALTITQFSGRLVHTGSAMAFGARHRPHHPDARYAPTSWRGMVKSCCSMIYEQCLWSTGGSFAELQIYTVYGPWEQLGRLIPEAMRALLEKRSISMTPKPCLRNWVYIDDVAEACLQAVVAEAQDVRVQVGNNRPISTHTVIQNLESISGERVVGDFEYKQNDRYVDEMLEIDLDCGANLIDWQPKVDLCSGLQQCWSWANTTSGRRYLLG